MVTPDLNPEQYWPQWAGSVLDQAAGEAIACAAAASGKHLQNSHDVTLNGSYCFPVARTTPAPLPAHP